MHLVRAALAIALAVFAGAGVPTAGAAHAGERTVLVFAAASLTDALDAALAAYRPADGIEIRVSYAASSTLARQIERGAPADIFLSAHPEWMDHLAARDLIDRSARQDLVANGLVLVGPDGGDETRLPATLDADYPLRAALGDGRLAMGDPDHVPAGLYAREALEALGHWDALAPRTARAANVRAALALVARGEAPLGLVYASDAVAEPSVRVLARVPESLHAPIRYPLAPTARGAGRPAVRDLLAYLRGADAAAIFARYGFRPLSPGGGS